MNASVNHPYTELLVCKLKSRQAASDRFVGGTLSGFVLMHSNQQFGILTPAMFYTQLVEVYITLPASGLIEHLKPARSINQADNDHENL